MSLMIKSCLPAFGIGKEPAPEMNLPRATLPKTDEEVRFAPAKGQEAASLFWRIWVQGSDIYAFARNLAGQVRLSVHASGQIHFRQGVKLKQDMAPLMRLQGEPWMHAFELRFLLSPGARKPPDQQKSLKNRSAQIIPVPEGFYLVVNLIIRDAGTPDTQPLPTAFSGAKEFWRRGLTDGRTAVLAVRMLPLDKSNSDQIRYLREQLRPTANFTGDPSEAYLEIMHLSYSAGGNVLVVVPMGDEAFRSIGEPSRPPADAATREFSFFSPACIGDILAPDGQCVARVRFNEKTTEVRLAKGLTSIYAVNSVVVQLEAKSLVFGSSFTAPPVTVTGPPSVGGGRPRNWSCKIFAKFDGTSLSVHVKGGSFSLRNSNDKVEGLRDDEELLLSLPQPEIQLSVTKEQPTAAAEVCAQFTVIDQNPPTFIPWSNTSWSN